MAHEEHHATSGTSYRVEVSGWDATESFFFEKAALYWDDAGQQVCLDARLREGTVVFIRLLQPFASQENFPVPYMVSKTLPTEVAGRASFLISRLHPKPSYRQSGSMPHEPHKSHAA